jgi:HEAT repeat protein
MLGERAPVEPLVAALRDESLSVREVAMLALRKLKAETLVEVLGEADRDTRRIAMETLGELRQKAPVEPLVAALGDSDLSVREAAIKVLQQSHPSVFSDLAPEAMAILLGQGSGKILGSLAQGFIAETIGNMQHASYKLLQQLMQLLDWPYWEVRMKAVEALGKIRRNIPDAAIYRIFELRHDSQSRAVREAADDALAEILSLETTIEDD